MAKLGISQHLRIQYTEIWTNYSKENKKELPGFDCWGFFTCSDISMSTRSFLMPIQTLFPFSCWAMLARSLSVKLPSSYRGHDTFSPTFMRKPVLWGSAITSTSKASTSCSPVEMLGMWMVVLKASSISISCNTSFLLVVPMMSSLRPCRTETWQHAKLHLKANIPLRYKGFDFKITFTSTLYVHNKEYIKTGL